MCVKERERRGGNTLYNVYTVHVSLFGDHTVYRELTQWRWREADCRGGGGNTTVCVCEGESGRERLRVREMDCSCTCTYVLSCVLLMCVWEREVFVICTCTSDFVYLP